MSMEQNEHKKEELMELRHDPVPGYKTIFYIVFSLGAAYLGWIFAFWKH